MITIVSAMTKDGVIGKNGTLPWHIPEDLQHFKATTQGHTIIMGWRTYQSIGKALPGRHTIVISDTGEPIPGVVVCASLDEALKVAKADTEEVFIAGGAWLYERALPLAEKMIITHIEKDYAGDTKFPAYNKHDWRAVENMKGNGFTITTYTRLR